MSPAPRQSRPGFTLVELLVASAIMVVIIVLVTKIAVDTMTAYDRVVADLSTQTEARAVLDNMERDLNTAVIRPDGRCWMEIIAPGASGDTSGLLKLSNVPSDLQPTVMFFAAPGDRPRWSVTGTTRTAIAGETSAVCYRLGRRSPFDLPGQSIQQIYCFQRTVIDAQNTFNEAIPLLTAPGTTPVGTPLTYWYASRSYISPYGAGTAGNLISSSSIDTANGNTTGGWTMDEQNFCAQNVVALSLTLWCASSEPAAVDKARRNAAVGLPPAALRPVVCYPSSTDDAIWRGAPGNAAGSGIRSAYGAIMSANGVTSDGKSDFFVFRARVYSDRIQTDNASAALPYSLRQLEASVTVLSPAGSRELRAVQASVGINANADSTTSAFRRIVSVHGRAYSRRMIVFGNGN